MSTKGSIAHLLLLFIAFSVVWSGKETGKKKKEKDKKVVLALPDRSFEQWISLPVETLRLHCEAVGVSVDGDNYDMALRLVRHYRGASDFTTTSTSLDPTAVGLDQFQDGDGFTNNIVTSVAAVSSLPLDWLTAPPPTAPISSTDMASLLTEMEIPSLAAPSGGFSFSVTDVVSCGSGETGVPRVTIRRAPICVTSLAPTNFPEFLDLSNQFSVMDPSTSTASDLPGPSSAASPPRNPATQNTSGTVISLQKELADLQQTMGSVMAAVEKLSNQGTLHNTG